MCTIGSVAWILGKWNIMPNILLDVETNTYSLSRFQAFAWTVVLLGSYFYIAICTGLVLRDGVIPDFNPSLIGLMSISYTGLISSHFLGKKNPKNEIKGQPPELSNLFATNGNIDISRLQLLCFTIVAIAVYLYNLIISNTLSGLPDIPPTLHGLLLTSQGSYIGGKLFGDKIAVNRIFPNLFSNTEKEIEFNMVGGVLGPWGVLATLFLASLLGTVFFFLMKLSRRLNWGAYLPFGPFLAIGAYLYYIAPGVWLRLLGL
jgi:prepilin signal peptidase PulO-like enzyme (type II secretory pathway)